MWNLRVVGVVEKRLTAGCVLAVSLFGFNLQIKVVDQVSSHAGSRVAAEQVLEEPCLALQHNSAAG